MTSMAMIAGMLPTAFAVSEGSEARQPMAVAVIDGMLTLTVLSLFPGPGDLRDRGPLRTADTATPRPYRNAKAAR
jgi:Cu/Ag efflux pump CusA